MPAGEQAMPEIRPARQEIATPLPDRLLDVVSTDRIRYELEKMFKHDTKLTLSWLNWLSTANHSLLNNILRDDLWFMPTTRS